MDGLCCLALTRDQEMLDTLREVFAAEHCDCEFTRIEIIAQQRMREKHFDIVLIDCDDMDAGLAVLSGVRSSRANARSVLVAIVNGETTTAGAAGLGANFALQKPLTPDNVRWLLRNSEEMIAREHRQHPRIPVNEKVYVTIGEHHELEGQALDLSEGGMAVQLSEVVDEDDLVHLKFRLPGQDDWVYIHGDVAWTTPEGKMGVRFQELPEHVRKHLLRWLALPPQSRRVARA
jgi:DNA-binding response OmpR family regulator